MIDWIEIALYLFSFAASFYALSCIRFELFTNVKEVRKVQTLLLLLSIGLAYLVAQFILMLTIYH